MFKFDKRIIGTIRSRNSILTHKVTELTSKLISYKLILQIKVNLMTSESYETLFLVSKNGNRVPRQQFILCMAQVLQRNGPDLACLFCQTWTISKFLSGLYSLKIIMNQYSILLRERTST